MAERIRTHVLLGKKRADLVPEDYFWAYVDDAGVECCWIWQGQLFPSGYAKMWGQIKGGYLRAHRWAYERLRGPIPPGLQLDHLCRNISCVNPAHMEPVTARVNIMRSGGVASVNSRKTHCKRGHPFDAENTYWYNGGKNRGCLICRRAISAAHRSRSS